MTDKLKKIVVASKEMSLRQLTKELCEQLFVADDISEAGDIIKTVLPDLLVMDSTILNSHQVTSNEIDNIVKSNIPVLFFHRNGYEKPRSMSAAYENFTFSEVDDIHSELQLTCQRLSNKNVTEDVQFPQEFFCDSFAATVPIAGKSKSITHALEMLKRVAASNCNPILVVGETGTGKELAARALHDIRHPKKKFVAINCAALTSTLLESELFGHVKGSFTGAEKDKTGLVEMAEDGTLFLDEITEMPMELQAKLLRVLQEKTYRKVGGEKELQCRATIVASSNRNLKEAVEEKVFRKDLFFRLSICPVTLAPLRSASRQEDITVLAHYFLRNSNICPEKNGQIIGFTKMALEQLENHDWPGNVRELANVIDRAILLESTDKIGASSIILNPEDPEKQENLSVYECIKSFSLEKAERELISRALDKTSWQKTKAASLLGITRATLYAKVRQYNICQANSENLEPALC